MRGGVSGCTEGEQMSATLHVVGFKPADEKWRAMKAVHDACKAAGLNTPEEVTRFFDWREPDELGVEISEAKLPVKPWKARQGLELDVSQLDLSIKVIRFYVSW